MEKNFSDALKAVLVHEGGYVNDPQDPGGETNKGVTKAVYDKYRQRKGLPERSVRHITSEEIHDIYKHQYWDAVKGDSLPSGVDYCVFDFAVNSGVSRAGKFLQRAVGTAADGLVGAATLAATFKCEPKQLIDEICDNRMIFLQGLSTFRRFGRGWTSRVEGVRAKAKGMA